jgi:hypothetical protein
MAIGGLFIFIVGLLAGWAEIPSMAAEFIAGAVFSFTFWFVAIPLCANFALLVFVKSTTRPLAVERWGFLSEERERMLDEGGNHWLHRSVSRTLPTRQPDWDLVDAMVLGLRQFDLTGSTLLLGQIGECVKDEGGIDRLLLMERMAEVRARFPILDVPIRRHHTPLVSLMTAHAALVAKGRSLPIHDVRWLKRYDRPIWYAFLNAGRIGRTSLYARGMGGVATYMAKGKDTRLGDIIRRLEESAPSGEAR